MDKIFWREKGTKVWREGWILKREGGKVKIGNYVGQSIGGLWYDLHDIEIEKRA